MIDYQIVIAELVGPDVFEAAKEHARSEFPKESCGFVARGKYYACTNKAEDPLKQFQIQDKRFDKALIDGKLQFVIHSHPNGPIFPSQDDMIQQVATDVPWVIITLNEVGFGQSVMWGDSVPIAPIIGRPFIHGVFDCFSCVRDVFRLGQEGLAKDHMVWPFPPIDLVQVPRDDCWWQLDQDLYQDHLASEGFEIIARSDARPGDGFLIAIGDGRLNPKKRLNHAGLLVGHDQILHHLPNRLSRREPAGVWARAADIWVRYTGKRRET